MRALTISQPWASIIARGDKFIENREWQHRYRGPLAIHAGTGRQYLSRRDLERGEYVTGAVIAVARLVDCLTLVDLTDLAAHHPDKRIGRRTAATLFAHQYCEGPYCLILEDCHPLDGPIQVNGQQGLWNWSEPPGLLNDYLRYVKSRFNPDGKVGN